MTGSPSPLGAAEQGATDITASHEDRDTAASSGSRCQQEVPPDTSGAVDGLLVPQESEHELRVAAAGRDSAALTAASQPQPLQMHSAVAPDDADAIDGLRSAADCEEFLRQLPGGRRALTQIADLTRGLNSRTECLEQEALTFMLQSWTNAVTFQLVSGGDVAPEQQQDQTPAVALAVESVAATAVRGRIVESLHTQHAAADAALLRTACALADGSANLMPRTPSMVREAEMLRRNSGRASGSTPRRRVSFAEDIIRPPSGSSFDHQRSPASTAAAAVAATPAADGDDGAPATPIQIGPQSEQVPAAASTPEEGESSRPASSAPTARRQERQGGSLPYDVLAMCGVQSCLRGVRLEAPAAAAGGLESVSCPLEGIVRLQAVTDALVSAADACQGPETADPISSDDLLPLLIATLVKAQIPHLFSCLQYLTAFHCSGDWNGREGFQLATLEAAIAFLQQQGQQLGRRSALVSLNSDDLDDAKHVSGQQLRRQSTMAALAAFLDSESPLTFTTASRTAGWPFPTPYLPATPAATASCSPSPARDEGDAVGMTINHIQRRLSAPTQQLPSSQQSHSLLSPQQPLPAPSLPRLLPPSPSLPPPSLLPPPPPSLLDALQRSSTGVIAHRTSFGSSFGCGGGAVGFHGAAATRHVDRRCSGETRSAPVLLIMAPRRCRVEVRAHSAARSIPRPPPPSFHTTPPARIRPVAPHTVALNGHKDALQRQGLLHGAVRDEQPSRTARPRHLHSAGPGMHAPLHHHSDLVGVPAADHRSSTVAVTHAAASATGGPRHQQPPWSDRRSANRLCGDMRSAAGTDEHDASFRPGSKPSHRSPLSPIMHLTLQGDDLQTPNTHPEAPSRALRRLTLSTVPAASRAQHKAEPGTSLRAPPEGFCKMPPSGLLRHDPAAVQMQPRTPVQADRVNRRAAGATPVSGSNPSSVSSVSTISTSGRAFRALAVEPQLAPLTSKAVQTGDDLGEWTEALLFSESEGDGSEDEVVATKGRRSKKRTPALACRDPLCVRLF